MTGDFVGAWAGAGAYGVEAVPYTNGDDDLYIFAFSDMDYVKMVGYHIVGSESSREEGRAYEYSSYDDLNLSAENVSRYWDSAGITNVCSDCYYARNIDIDN